MAISDTGIEYEVKYEEVKDNEILYKDYIFFRDARGKYCPITNGQYFGLNGLLAKELQRTHGTNFTIYRKVNKALNAHNEMVARVEDKTKKPGYPLSGLFLEDKFTISSGMVDIHKGSISANTLLPILQQILTNQKEIMEILNTRPEDKIIEKKFLDEFDEKMKEALKL